MDFSSFAGFAQAMAAMSGQGGMDGDWQCPNDACINHKSMVFGKHASCPSCGTARGAKSVGDWLCPNSACVNAKNCVFASKSSCPKCGAQKPSYVQSAGTGGGGTRGAWTGGGYGGMDQQMKNVMATLAKMTGMQLNLRDWPCPNQDCVNNTRMVFGKHESCPQCGMSKPAWANLGRGGENPADWKCPSPDCVNNKNFVFAKHDICPRCSMPRPDGPGGIRNRSRSPLRMR